MKKKVLCFAAALMGMAVVADAQVITSGSLEGLRNEKVVNFVVDFSNCIIDKKPARVKIASEENWDKGVSEISKRFAESAYEYVDLKFENAPDARYSLVYHIAKIDDDQDCEGTMVLVDNQSNSTVATISKANGKAGHFGSFFNLLGDAFQNLGKRIGKLMAKSFK